MAVRQGQKSYRFRNAIYPTHVFSHSTDNYCVFLLNALHSQGVAGVKNSFNRTLRLLYAQWCMYGIRVSPTINATHTNSYEQIHTSHVSNLRLLNWSRLDFWFDSLLLLLLSFEFVELYYLLRVVGSSNISVNCWNLVWIRIADFSRTNFVWISLT